MRDHHHHRRPRNQTQAIDVTHLNDLLLAALVTFLTLAALAALFPTHSHAVMNGTPITADQPAKRAIVNIKHERGMCSGTMVAPNATLSAAHCRDLFGEPQFVAYIDSNSKTEPCEIAKVIETEYAPNAIPILPRRVHAPDMTLLHLETEVCNVGIATIAEAAPQLGERLLGSGHGGGSGKFAEPPQFEMQFVEVDEARNNVSPMDSEYEELLSVGARTYMFALPTNPGSSFCKGDSGGPIFNERNGSMIIYGVNGAVLPHMTEGASETCDYGRVQIITPLAPYKAWIEEKINEWNPARVAAKALRP